MSMYSKKNVSVFIFVMIILLASITILAFFFTQRNDNSQCGQNAEKKISVLAKTFEFTPSIINATLGETITLCMMSIDIQHGFGIREFGIFNEPVPVGEENEVKILLDQTGEFVFYCTVLCGVGHANHLGTLIVTA